MRLYEELKRLGLVSDSIHEPPALEDMIPDMCCCAPGCDNTEEMTAVNAILTDLGLDPTTMV